MHIFVVFISILYLYLHDPITRTDDFLRMIESRRVKFRLSEVEWIRNLAMIPTLKINMAL